jgi:hypothetical protein
VERARRIASGTSTHPALRASIGGFAAAVVRLGTVDPITTELVRIRCAHHHDCGT